MSARSGKSGKTNKGRPAGRTYKKKRHETFNLYIFKVLKQVHPKLGMSKKGMGHFIRKTTIKSASQNENSFSSSDFDCFD